MISVCIATYNGDSFIRRQLETILPQLSPDDEIIISDDGSTDKTLSIIQSLSSPLIKVYQNTGIHGYTPNFENALRMAKGDYIFLCDQDDVWLPNKVAICMKLLQTYDMVISDAELVDEQEKKISSSFYQLRKPYRSFWGNMLKFGYIGCCMCFRRCILERAMPFPKNHRYCTHDNWLTLVSLLYYSTKVVNDKLVLYRRHGKNASNGFVNLHESFWFRLSYRTYLLKNLLQRISCGRNNKHVLVHGVSNGK
jgi:glycosyltransferase involved in cell wall biosynthesis